MPHFPTVANTATSSTDTQVSTHTVSLPTGIQSGDLLIVGFCCGSAVTATFPAGWTKLYDVSVTLTMEGAVAYRVADGTEGATITVTTSDTDRAAHQSFRITGYAGTPEAGTTVSANTNLPDPPSLSPSWGADDTLWLVFMAENGAETITTYPTNYGNGVLVRAFGNGDPGLATCYRTLNAVSEDPGTLSISASDWTIANTVAVRGLIAPSFVTIQFRSAV